MAGIGWACCLGAACSGVQAQIRFENVTAAVGIDFVHHDAVPGPAPAFGSGAAVADYDRDGDLDLYLCDTRTHPNQLWRNDGGTFTEVAAAAGVADTRGSQLALFLDLDNDGWRDLFVANNGDVPQSAIYRNNGDGTFTDRSATALISAVEEVFGGATAADYDLDGDLDLYLTGWGIGNVWLFRNDGDFAFTDVTIEAGARPDRGLEPIFAWTPILADLDDDRRPDVFVAVDFSPNFLLRNNGDGTFSDVTAGSGCAHDGNDMGVAVADFDGDLDLDFYITNITGSPESTHCPPGTDAVCNSMNVRRWGLLYDDFAATIGVGDTGWGWGTAFVDADLDGDRDLYAVNGFYDLIEVQQRASFFRNDDGTFVEVGEAAGLDHPGDSRSLTPFDYDNDGDVDLLVLDVGGPAALFENLTPRGDRHWLIVTPTAAPGENADGVGARVYVTADGVTQMAEIIVGGSFYASPPLNAHFGLGPSTTVHELRIEYPQGEVVTVFNVPVDRRVSLGPLAEVRHTLQDVLGDGASRLSWDAVDGADSYAVMRGSRRGLASGNFGNCPGEETAGTFADDAEIPVEGGVFTYLVRATNALGVAGPLGTDSDGTPREVAGCR